MEHPIVIKISKTGADPLVVYHPDKQVNVASGLAAALGVAVTDQRGAYVYPLHKGKRALFKALRRRCGGRGIVADWTRRWRGPWVVVRPGECVRLPGTFVTHAEAVRAEVTWILGQQIERRIAPWSALGSRASWPSSSPAHYSGSGQARGASRNSETENREDTEMRVRELAERLGGFPVIPFYGDGEVSRRVGAVTLTTKRTLEEYVGVSAESADGYRGGAYSESVREKFQHFIVVGGTTYAEDDEIDLALVKDDLVKEERISQICEEWFPASGTMPSQHGWESVEGNSFHRIVLIRCPRWENSPVKIERVLLDGDVVVYRGDKIEDRCRDGNYAGVIDELSKTRLRESTLEELLRWQPGWLYFYMEDGWRETRTTVLRS